MRLRLVLVGLFLAVLAVGGCAVKATASPTASAVTAATTVGPSNPVTTPLDLRGTYTADVDGTTATSGV